MARYLAATSISLALAAGCDAISEPTPPGTGPDELYLHCPFKTLDGSWSVVTGSLELDEVTQDLATSPGAVFAEVGVFSSDDDHSQEPFDGLLRFISVGVPDFALELVVPTQDQLAAPMQEQGAADAGTPDDGGALGKVLPAVLVVQKSLPRTNPDVPGKRCWFATEVEAMEELARRGDFSFPDQHIDEDFQRLAHIQLSGIRDIEAPATISAELCGDDDVSSFALSLVLELRAENMLLSHECFDE